jgi:hypothetical protein
MAAQVVIVKRDEDAAIMEQVVVVGDLAGMRPEQRVNYYRMVCKSLGLNELTKPFDYIKLNNKLTLYARKDATEQLRKINKVSITQLDKETSEGVYIVTAYARSGDGRTDSDVGAVSIQGLSGEAKANAMMKAITKAKRRVTLSICGLGFLDETEVDSIPDARPVAVDHATGEIVEGHVVEPRVEQPRQRPAVLDAPAPVEVQVSDDTAGDDIEVPANLPVTASDFIDMVDAHRAQQGKATFTDLGDKRMYVVCEIVKKEGIPGFNWNRLKDDANRAQAYKTLMAHERTSEKQLA